MPITTRTHMGHFSIISHHIKFVITKHYTMRNGYTQLINSLLRIMGETMQKIRPDMDIGHNIQRLRRGAGMTQDQVVAKLQLMGLSISKSTYAKLETNRMNIKVSELVALRELFQAEFQDFFAGLTL